MKEIKKYDEEQKFRYNIKYIHNQKQDVVIFGSTIENGQKQFIFDPWIGRYLDGFNVKKDRWYFCKILWRYDDGKFLN